MDKNFSSIDLETLNNSRISNDSKTPIPYMVK